MKLYYIIQHMIYSFCSHTHTHGYRAWHAHDDNNDDTNSNGNSNASNIHSTSSNTNNTNTSNGNTSSRLWRPGQEQPDRVGGPGALIVKHGMPQYTIL